MKQIKNVAISFRASAHFKEALVIASARDNRSQSNLLETLLFEHCRRHGITVPVPESGATAPDPRHPRQSGKLSSSGAGVPGGLRESNDSSDSTDPSKISDARRSSEATDA